MTFICYPAVATSPKTLSCFASPVLQAYDDDELKSILSAITNTHLEC